MGSKLRITVPNVARELHLHGPGGHRTESCGFKLGNVAYGREEEKSVCHDCARSFSMPSGGCAVVDSGEASAEIVKSKKILRARLMGVEGTDRESGVHETIGLTRLLLVEIFTL